MLDFFRKLFLSDFMPHVYCLREPGLIKLHFLCDGIIALSYALIPLALVLLIRRRRDLVFPWMFSLFGIFILGCGLTHVMGIVTLWHPAYRLDGFVKAITAGASFPTALILFRLLPRIESLPSPSQLQAEITQRKFAELRLRELNEQLEQHATDRTLALEEANRKLAESEECFRTLAEAVPNLLWTVDEYGLRTYSSPRYELYSGLPAPKLIGSDWKTLLHPDDLAHAEAAWKHALEMGDTYESEYRLRRFDGRYRWFVARAIPMRDEEGRVTKWLGSSTDIDDLKRTEGALRRSNEELRQFAYAAAHDLQEPLRDVANCVGMLRRLYRDQLDEGAVKWIDTSVEGARRMQNMVQDLLSYSRALDGTDRPDTLVEAGEAAQLAIANLATAIRNADARIEIQTLPAVRVHQTHLVQIFQNLVANSIKYRRPGVTPIISVSACRVGTDWQFSVIDNGIGFDPAYAQKIFGVFKRLHQRNEYPGNGIGLAICVRIVSHYGGRIWAESQPGDGATFRFTFPVPQEA